MNTGKSIRVAIVDDHTLVREGLIGQLSRDEEIEVIMEARNGSDMLKQLHQSIVLPDIAIIDLKMPVMDGFTLADMLKKSFSQIRILVLSGFCSDFTVANMINKGIRGYLLKDCRPEEFRTAIRSIYMNGFHYSPQADEKTFKILQDNNLKSINIPDREMEFLKLCCSELSYDQIATEMGISKHTVDGCRERLCDRLGIRSRNSLILFAMRSGIAGDFPGNNSQIKNKENL